MILEHLVQLESSNLLRLAQTEPELEYLFRHALVQDAAYYSLLKSDRRQLHLAVGEALEAIYGEQVEELAGVLGYHFHQAEESARALAYYTLAGDVAYQRYALEEAILLYRQALALAGTAKGVIPLKHLYTRLGRTLELRAQYEAARILYEEMEQVGRAGGDNSLELWSLTLQSTLYATPGALHDLSKGLALAERALAMAEVVGEREAEAKNLWNLLILHKYLEQMKAAQHYGERSLDLARQEGLREQVAYTLHDLHLVYIEQGEIRRGFETLYEAIALWRELGNRAMLADGLASCALLYTMNGQYERAMALAEEALSISEEIDNPWNRCYSRLILVHIYAERGTIAQAIEAAERCLLESDRIGFFPGQIRARTHLALLHSALGSHAESLRWAEIALEQIRRYVKDGEPTGLGLLALCQVRQGLLLEAAQTIQAAYAPTDSQLLEPTGPFLPLAEIELALAQGEYEQPIQQTEQVARATYDTGIHWYVPDLLYLRAQALLGLGRIDEAHTLLLKAREKVEAQGARRLLWRLLARLADVEAQRGHLLEAATYRQQARATVEFILSHLPSAALRASFRQMPEVRALLTPEGFSP